MPKPVSEKDAIQQVLATAKELGCVPNTVDNGAEVIVLPWSEKDEFLLSALMRTEEDTVTFHDPQTGESTSVLFVYGNDPDEVMANYTCETRLGAELDALLDEWIAS